MGLAIWLLTVFCAVFVLRIAWLGLVYYKRRRSRQDSRHHNHSHSCGGRHDHGEHVFSAWHDARYIDGDRLSARHGTPSGWTHSGWNHGSYHSSGGGVGGSDSGWGSGDGDSGSWGGSDESSSSSSS